MLSSSMPTACAFSSVSSPSCVDNTLTAAMPHQIAHGDNGTLFQRCAGAVFCQYRRAGGVQDIVVEHHRQVRLVAGHAQKRFVGIGENVVADDV